MQGHRVTLSNGLVYEVGLESRIDQAVLLGREEHPDHIWEPLTTRLLVALAAGSRHVLVGGAYIGDHVLPIAQTLRVARPPGTVHAFEPMASIYRRLLRNIELNCAENIVAHQLGLWDEDDVAITVDGVPGLAFAAPVADQAFAKNEGIRSITIDSYVRKAGIKQVGLVMLDIEGGEERALRGASNLIHRDGPEAPHLVFEIHRDYVDWTPGLEKTSIVAMLTAVGYAAYAIRDFQNNYPMGDRPIEVIPVDHVYLEGPPHGFNMLATKDHGLVDRLGLRVVSDVSPKLLVEKDPTLHHPVGGL